MVAGINATGNKAPVRNQKSAIKYIVCPNTIENPDTRETGKGKSLYRRNKADSNYSMLFLVNLCPVKRFVPRIL
jgi:hypothetical protein